jgi:hypothetical protein
VTDALRFSLFFAVLAGNYQRTTSRFPHKFSAADGSGSEKTAKSSLFFRCYPLFLCETSKRREGQHCPKGFGAKAK